ncbi:PREDICTED: uncharacterized protein LOC104801284 [Tarenaya hassleriana]|uniref:uncharacterized protein LOC104801284 n=1 Tax=Tarenaya hassleriana TaxID=28532 RepID=UPI00053C9A83|nr:PREDICTED: uncharacterized protein LOC104801284 [Tarenaya hassleriana]
MSASPATSSAATRLWRPAAHRNLRNQWSKLSNYRKQWIAASSAGRSHATSLVNSFLSLKYIPHMELGVLSDMLNIRKKASDKLCKQQDSHRSNLLSSYKEMVGILVELVNASRSMRCYIKISSSPLLQFSSSPEDANDAGDGGDIPVCNFWTVSTFEQMAEELVEMFRREVILKRLLVLELVALSTEVPQPDKLSWSTELYHGESEDLAKCCLYSTETPGPVPPCLRDNESVTPTLSHTAQPTEETLQIYLTTWLTEVNIDTHRVDEILSLAGEEMRVTL